MRSTPVLLAFLKFLELLHFLLGGLAFAAAVYTYQYAKIAFFMWHVIGGLGLLGAALVYAGISIKQRRRLFYLQSFELLLVLLSFPIGVLGIIVLNAPAVVELFDQEKEKQKSQKKPPALGNVEQPIQRVKLSALSVEPAQDLTAAVQSKTNEVLLDYKNQQTPNRKRFLRNPVYLSAACLIAVAVLWAIKTPYYTDGFTQSALTILLVLYIVANLATAIYCFLEKDRPSQVLLTPLLSLFSVRDKLASLEHTMENGKSGAISQKDLALLKQSLETHYVEILASLNLSNKNSVHTAHGTAPSQLKAAAFPDEIVLLQTTKGDRIFARTLILGILLTLIATTYTAYVLKSQFAFISAVSVLTLILLSVTVRYSTRDRTVRLSTVGFSYTDKTTPQLIKWGTVNSMSVLPVNGSSIEFRIKSRNKELNFWCENLFRQDFQRINKILKQVTISNVPINIDPRLEELAREKGQIHLPTSSADSEVNTSLLNTMIGPKKLDEANAFASDHSLTYQLYWKQSFKNILVCTACRLFLFSLILLKQEFHTPGILTLPYTYLFVLFACCIGTPRRSITLSDKLIIPNALMYRSEIEWKNIAEISLHGQNSLNPLDCLIMRIRTFQNEDLTLQLVMRNQEDLAKLLHFLNKQEIPILFDQAVETVIPPPLSNRCKIGEEKRTAGNSPMETEISEFRNSCLVFIELCEKQATKLEAKSEREGSIVRRWTIILPALLAGLLPLICLLTGSSLWSGSLLIFGVNIAIICPLLSIICLTAILAGLDKVGNRADAIVHTLRSLSDEARWLAEQEDLLPAEIRTEALGILKDKKSVLGIKND
ncbi:MAG: hypothetical protein K2X77_29560 [Candidatus Obscuribacterales bacterium]|jgi:hypothetical protein|nr:hypothetical protein [Candidatus Obscuribacterales bacterium]